MEKLIKFLGIIGLIVALSFLFALPVLFLWNAVMPDIFGLPEINFWQALCLTLLSNFLFKNSSSNNK